MPIAAATGLTPVPSALPTVPTASALIAAAQALLPMLARGQSVDARALREAMISALGGSDAEGVWAWKDAYEACEVAQLLFLRRFGPAMRARSAPAQLAMLGKVAALLPTHTRRSEESQALQQFSTPIPLSFVAATAAAVTADDVVLEPSAGTGLLAVSAELAGGAGMGPPSAKRKGDACGGVAGMGSASAKRRGDACGGASLVLNELGEIRADLLTSLFPATAVTRFDAAHIDDHLDPQLRPSVVLMNPPFSAGAHVAGRVADAAYRHIASALARLADGGRLVAITGASFSPENPAWADAFARLRERGRVVFTAAVDGRLFARHGTTTETRLTVIDRVTASGQTGEIASLGMAPDAATLLDWVMRHIPPRPACTPSRCSDIAGGAEPLPSRSVRRMPRARSHPSRRTRPNWPTRLCVLRRSELPVSARRSTSPSRCRPFASRAHGRIRRRSCSRPPWRACVRRCRPTGRTCPPAWSSEACYRTPSSRAWCSRARRTRPSSRAPGRWTPPSTWSRPHRRTPKRRSASGAGSCWATAPARARAARSRASSSTTG